MKITNKIFGIYADAFNGKVGQTFAYMQYFSQLGFVRLISTTDRLDNMVNEIDVLVVPGGADVLAMKYSGVPGVMDGRVNQHYEYLDSVLIPQFVESRKPIIGICRGLQAINVHFGGTLLQHINGHHQGENRSKAEETVYLTEPIVKGNKTISEINVNTLHHQCIDVLGDGLSILGYGLFYGPTSSRHTVNIKLNKEGVKSYQAVPEIIQHNELPIIAFQYHPEEFNCPYATSKILEII